MLRLVVGLGNPTPKYSRTRHNVGREFVDYLKHEQTGSMAALSLDCFMNESGGPLKKLMMADHMKPDEIVVVVDDFMIPFGTLRLRPGGSSGGHNGLKSIIESLGTDQFPRLRIGVGPVPPGEDPADYVLKKFSREEQIQLSKLFSHAKDGLDLMVSQGVEKAMNATNKSYL